MTMLEMIPFTRPARHQVDAHKVGEDGVDVEVVGGRQIDGLLPADAVDAVLLFDKVGLVAHGGDHRVDVGQLAPQAEVGGR